MKKLFCSLLIILPFLCMAENNEARLLRFPSVGGDRIAFTYAGDLYTVSIDGGVAVKLTSDVGYEMFSRFSPDGKTIAFTAQYDGNTEVYTIPAEGGVPKRITFTASVERDNVGDRMGPNNIVMCWTPDGKNIVLRSKWYNFSGLRGHLCTIPAEGGELTQIPTTEGGFCSYSPDGKNLAMNRMFREFRTWKHYRGGQADDIWINRVGTTKLENITNNDAQDIFPMWVGNEIYFLSDRDSIMNLFCYDTKTKQTSKLTDFDNYDCKFPSFSKDYIVFENGGYIYKYSVKEKKNEKVSVILNAEGLYARNKFTKPPFEETENRRSMGMRTNYTLSPDGQRVIMNVHGDIFSLPAEQGATYNLTNTPDAQEREAIWSPDGKYIAFFSDLSGEYQLYLLPSDNISSDPSVRIQLTDFKDGYPEGLSWSPDSKTLYFTTEKRDFYAVDIATKSVNRLFQCKFNGIYSYDISPDGKFIAYSTENDNRMNVIYIYNVADKTHHAVTSSWYDAVSPIFSGDGKYLFYSSAREYKARYSRVEWNASYDVESYLFVTSLTKNAANPTLISGNEYGKQQTKENGKTAEKSENVTVTIDYDGIVERSFALPLPSGRYMLIASFGDELYFSEGGETKKVSMKDGEVKPVMKGRMLSFTPDGKKAIVPSKGKIYVASAPGFQCDKTPVPTDGAVVLVDYHKEWKQIFDETWRVYRDYFYVHNMVGKDWKFIHDKYAELLPYVNHRQDLTYIIGEMISELTTGHCYVTTGEAPEPEMIKTGLLGGKFSKDKSGAFRIDHIFKGVSWGEIQRSPLNQEGLNVSEGDYILSINGVPCSEMKTIYEALVGKVGVTVALKVNSSASEKGARTIYVKPVADESKLAYYEWVQNNIRKVSEATDGQVGYIHIPDMSIEGLDAFTKLFYSQLDKKALIIDDRMNGGGNVSPMILERLQRVAYRMNMYNNGGEGLNTVPEAMHYGPKVCLVDKYSSSDGDLFPYGFQKLGIGPLIGMRTWGGIVGISGSKPYLDGQDVRTPFFTSYSTEGDWIIENHGVDPDIVVDINPFEDYLGKDAQLNKAIEVVMEQLKSVTPLPGTPADPVR